MLSKLVNLSSAKIITLLLGYFILITVLAVSIGINL
jgi:hypothetical protein